MFKNTFISIYDRIFQASTFETVTVVRISEALPGLHRDPRPKRRVCRLLVATRRQRSGGLKGGAGGGRAQRMLPPVAAPHCGICSRPFILLT